MRAIMAAPQTAGRFKEVEEEDIRRLLNDKDSKSTKRTIKQRVKLFCSYLAEFDVNTGFEYMPKEELNKHLWNFYATVCTKDGKSFKKSTLNGITYGLSKFLKREINLT